MGFITTASELKNWPFDESTGWIDPEDFAGGCVRAWNKLHPHKYILPSGETHINFWDSCIGPYTFTETPTLRTIVAPRLAAWCSSGKAYPAMWRTLETLVANVDVLDSIVPSDIVSIRDKGTSPLMIYIGIDAERDLAQTEFECLGTIGAITERVVICSVDTVHPRSRSVLRRAIQRQCRKAQIVFVTSSDVCVYFQSTV